LNSEWSTAPVDNLRLLDLVGGCSFWGYHKST
jgi:hypothetical protein